MEAQVAADSSNGTSTGATGIIYPPLDIKTIVDKTAEHVAKSGEAFQQLIRDKYQGNVKFSFIYPNDPYFAYYQHMVDKFKSGDTSEPAEKAATSTEQEGEDDAKEKAATSTEQEGEDDAKEVAPEKPDPMRFAFPMPAISAQDLDVIKLTAQFVACNGRQFMTSLAQREANNYQFDFLSPNHTLFGYFRKLVDQYSLVLSPPEDLKERVEKDREDKYQEADREKEAFLSIDWHDFVVVGAVEFVEEDAYMELPEPLRLQDLKSMSLEEKRKAKSEGASNTAGAGPSPGYEHMDEDDDDVEMEMDDEEDDVDEEIEAEKNPSAAAPPPSAISIGPMKIRKDYVPNLRRGPQTSEVTLQCQLCRLEIPASEFEEHIRVELIDPKWKEQKLAYERKIRDTNLVQEGMDIARYLKQMATHRTDIFGNEKSEEEDAAAAASQSRVYWDGYSSTAGQAARRARENMSVDEQIAAIHRKKGLADTGSAAQEIGPQMGPPDAKRQRTADRQR
ncbi:Surp module [Martensiomyces pterosporus]|nr:Surp module [Martensiomyces pterosporus]